MLQKILEVGIFEKKKYLNGNPKSKPQNMYTSGGSQASTTLGRIMS